MQQKISLKLTPAQAADSAGVKQFIANACGLSASSITGYTVLKKSIDARKKQVFINITVQAFINEPFVDRPKPSFQFQSVQNSEKKVLIIGAGPAGLFAALKLIESGIKPIIIERGKDVKSRRRDLAVLNKSGILNPESNYCFGEGGAGTYSDGKLYTRSNKRGDIHRILNLFVHFGAPDTILIESHPHIGTNKLPAIITAMRQLILDCGGELIFEKKLIGFNCSKGTINSAVTHDRQEFTANSYILATGHSARDIYQMLYNQQILIESKPFALGVRIEHPQELVDQIQYHCPIRDENLPPASYSLVQQVNGRAVFSFCMCPGGIIAPAATSAGELVVNGWSPSKRNNPFANSGMVVQVSQADAYNHLKKFAPDENDPLLLMKFQQQIEQLAFTAGSGNFKAPAARMTDFVDKKISTNLPKSSYQPGIVSTRLTDVLPDFIYQALSGGFKAFGKKMSGFLTTDAVVVATESRTSSPVRIPRNQETGNHPQITNLYPCAEGAGYAGGIVSAAMDGEWIASRISEKLNR